MSISSIASLAASFTPISPVAQLSGASGAADFSSLLKSAINQVESTRNSANTSIQNFLSGENGELHSTILATQKAELQFELFMQARNKVVSAYGEIMKMQV